MTSPDAYARVEGWSAIEAVGRDAGKFLQNLCTNDVLKLADGESCEAMFLDVKAHVQAYGWVSRTDAERYVVLLSSDHCDRLHAHLDRYLIREKVDLKLVPPGVWTIGRGVASALTVRVDAFGAGVVAALDAEAVEGRLMTAEAFEQTRIALRVPLDGVDVDDRNLPQEVDRNDRSISFTKGCYLGQEPVARIDALGRVNWLLRCVRIEDGTPLPGVELMLDAKPVGRVTSSVATEGGAIALAYVRREHSGPGGELRVDGLRAAIAPA
ncbi:YgfZ/GcvT domain-containing protein [Botrimarina mediterranea]|uniref:CAF17-like 4Fe-4S cluster assembly/insertion protein YgfZ n=1 Tax=Botrimarina mediterranea TaxID=2528022 RepID=UPI00118CC86A|nr:putative global regulator [Planctomycetes bacterium K2D]